VPGAGWVHLATIDFGGGPYLAVKVRMRTPFVALLLAPLMGCAVVGEGGIPVHAPPFSSDARVVRPEAPVGELVVEAYPPSPTSKAGKPNGPWRLFDAEGRPVSPVLRENVRMALPVGWYVIIGRDPVGSLHLAQVEVGSGATTKISLPKQASPMDASYVPDHFEE
jgi:hypothetical protein